MNRRYIIGGVLIFATTSLSGASTERLVMRVTPLVADAPTVLIVQTRIEPSETNRWIEIVAESADFYRSAEVGLDRERSPRSSRFEFRDLPAGRYEVAAVLTGTQGVLALKRQAVQAWTVLLPDDHHRQVA